MIASLTLWVDVSVFSAATAPQPLAEGVSCRSICIPKVCFLQHNRDLPPAGLRGSRCSQLTCAEMACGGTLFFPAGNRVPCAAHGLPTSEQNLQRSHSKWRLLDRSSEEEKTTRSESLIHRIAFGSAGCSCRRDARAVVRSPSRDTSRWSVSVCETFCSSVYAV